MHKILLILLISVLLFSGCGKSDLPPMDQLAEDEKYHYRNKGLGFNINLPKEFKYYQTQRKENKDFIDIEFFIPTSDISYPQEVPSYAKSIAVRVFDKNTYDAIVEENRAIYEKIGEKRKKIYTIKFWDKVPGDWVDKWSEDMKNDIVRSFEVN